MSTDLSTTTRPTDAAVPPVTPQYDNKDAAGFVAPPEGFRYMRNPVDKKVLLGQDGKPVCLPKKKSKGRKKQRKPTYLVPDNGIMFPVPIPDGYDIGVSGTPGFDVNTHAKLKVTDFPDPLHAAMWEEWYFLRKADIAKRDVERMLDLGETIEERKAAKEEDQALKAVEALLSKKGGKASKLLERLGKLFVEADAK